MPFFLKQHHALFQSWAEHCSVRCFIPLERRNVPLSFGVKQALFGSPVYYDSSSKLGYFEQKRWPGTGSSPKTAGSQSVNVFTGFLLTLNVIKLTVSKLIRIIDQSSGTTDRWLAGAEQRVQAGGHRWTRLTDYISRSHMSASSRCPVRLSRAHLYLQSDHLKENGRL